MCLLCSEKLFVLLLLVVEPVGRADVLRLCRLLFEPTGYRILELGLVAHALGKCTAQRPKAGPVGQRAWRAQTLQLGRAVDPVARPGSGRLDQAHGLEVPQHARRPAGRLGGLVDREPILQGREPYQRCVKVQSGSSSLTAFPLLKRVRSAFIASLEAIAT